MHVKTGEGQRARGRENLRQGPRPSAEPDLGLDLTTVRSLLEPKSRVGRLTQLSHPATTDFYFLKCIICF